MKYTYFLTLLFFLSLQTSDIETDEIESTVFVHITHPTFGKMRFFLTEECPICQKPNLRYERSHTLRCGHNMHQWCMSQCLKAQCDKQPERMATRNPQLTCPVCQQDHLLMKFQGEQEKTMKSGFKILKKKYNKKHPPKLLCCFKKKKVGPE